jgi:putative component of toxin-antitoxin plasmid stabilization module/predicted DNA-binding protein YlxM (UPF0122 family)
MPKDLLLNHYSIRDDGTLSDNQEQGKSILFRFFNTIKEAIKCGDFEQYYISDTSFWEVAPSQNITLGEFVNNLPRQQKQWIYELRRLSQKPTDILFKLELLEKVISYTPKLHTTGNIVETLGYTACIDDIVVISFATEPLWNDNKIFIDWYDKDKIIPHEDYDLGNCIYNISLAEHIPTVLEFFPPQEIFLNHDVWLKELPTTEATEEFWLWFDALEDSARICLFRKAQDIQKKNWHARYKTSFQQLGSGLCEMRCWPRGGKPLRVYVKVVTFQHVILLLGSDKDGQEDAIRDARKILSSTV